MAAEEKVTAAVEGSGRRISKAGHTRQTDQLTGAVDTDVASIKPPQHTVGDPDEDEIAIRLGDDETAARHEHARHLRERPRRIWVVMKRRRTHHRGERPFREGKLLAIADDELDAAGLGRERTRPVDHRRRDVDANRPLHRPRRGANRSTRATTDIEEAVIETQRQPSKSSHLRASIRTRTPVTLIAARPAIKTPPRNRLGIAHSSPGYSQTRPRPPA